MHGAGGIATVSFAFAAANAHAPEFVCPIVGSLVEKGLLEREPAPDGDPEGGTGQGRVRVTKTGEGVYLHGLGIDGVNARHAARGMPEGWHRG